MKSQDSTVLVTGGLGYIGSHVVRQVLDRGWKVRVLDNRYRSDPGVARQIADLDRVEVIEGDVRYAHMVESATRGVEAVVHLAAVCMNKSIADPTESLDVNLMGTQNVLDAAGRAGVRRIVYGSSASVYGDPKSLPMFESGPFAPITPYCVAKLAGEQMLDFYGRRTKMSWLALRFFNVYGPGQPTDAYYTSVVNTFLNRIARGEAPVIDGKGSQSMDFVHVEDVARAVALALDSEATGEALNVGTGRQTTIAELAEVLIKHLGVDVQPTFSPREVLVTQREASIDRIHQVLGWEPAIDFEYGIGTVIDWLKSSGHPQA
ncbi:NAD-dependent epimerase/dehydratase family protein [Nocardioides marmorisolisilvae]|uniref:NAD-dependent epimerase/dehydratase family protein n=1 Tax=Nocardioides marmorisolisilvae TaxID=1542737 RepID=A0A3N0DTX1_9ACTN|nr:NAD-dependent epimerase/dehydratase family protein [Nocardioides marmorisolisilvae]RNL79067.1 NAD-dependent epimerase/dehydratase family protein [Nocardioides marmorisolisilvae]